jgi:ADP-heptose:LPS heptosyltransferase
MNSRKGPTQSEGSVNNGVMSTLYRFLSAAGRGPHRLRKPRPRGRYRYVRLRWHVLFGVVDLLGESLWRWMRRRVAHHGERGKPFEEPRSILLVQLDHLGDAVITAAVLPALRRRFPKARLEVLAAPWNREVFEACEEVDRVHVSRVNRFARGWRPHWLLVQAWWGLRLRRRRFDLGIDLRGELPLAAILWLAGVKRRVGWDCGGGGFLLTDSAKFVAGRPEMLSRLALLDRIGIAAPAEVLDKRAWFTPPEAARSTVAMKLDRHTANNATFAVAGREMRTSDCGMFVVHLGAGTPAKRWPAAHWRELLGRIAVEIGARVVLVGGRSERPLAAQVLENRAWPEVDNWTGQLAVAETAALIEQADLFIGADSGPAHLAAAVGTPAVVLFSGTNRVRQWRPWGETSVVKHSVGCSPCHRETCPLAGHFCMTLITPEVVMGRVRAVLASENRHPSKVII